MVDDDGAHPLAALIWANVQALMLSRWGEINITRLGREAKIAQGGAQRLQRQAKVGPPLLAKVAALFGVEPWQLLAPKLGADLYRIDDQRRVVNVYAAEYRAPEMIRQPPAKATADRTRRAGESSSRIISSPYTGVERRKKAIPRR
jgi:hypothetical protein